MAKQLLYVYYHILTLHTAIIHTAIIPTTRTIRTIRTSLIFMFLIVATYNKYVVHLQLVTKVPVSIIYADDPDNRWL